MSAPLALPPPAAVQRIACFTVGGLGDVVCQTPTIEALRRRYPDAHLTVVMRAYLAELIEGNPYVDDLLFFDASSPARFAFFLRAARRRRFDLWVDLHVPTFNTVRSNHRDFFRNALVMCAAGARWRRAYGVSWLRPFTTHPLHPPDAQVKRTTSVVETTLALADATLADDCRKHVPIGDDDRAWARQALPETERRRIALYFGSRQPADLWPRAQIEALIGKFAATLTDTEIVVIGGEQDRAIGAHVTALARTGGLAVHDFSGRCGIARSAALLQRCDAFVSTDSGPLHMADALGVPIVALFASKNYPRLWQPVHAPAEVLNHPVECGPCFRPSCPRSNHCMNLISAEEVLHAVQRMLAAYPRHSVQSR